jgi:epoxyqueuosine reductase
MIAMTSPDYSLLDDAGLNLRAVFAIDRLPAPFRESLAAERNYRQLILVGNGGRALWSALKNDGIESADPIDDFSVRSVNAWLAEEAAGCRHEIVYPGNRPIALQSLGTLAGWHFASPFMVGINARWGTWHAYRAVVLADTDFVLTRPEVGASPCQSCRQRFCLDACPGMAMTDGCFALQKCVSYRKRQGSACRANCLARLACPVGSEHRYDGEQIRHSYSISMQMIERHY